MLLAPRRHLEAIPTYAVIDVLRCAKRSPAALARVVGGKVVLVGGTLPEEDRKAASGRLLVPPADAPAIDACGLKRLGASAPDAANVPGVFLHAASIEAVLTGRLTSTAPVLAVAGVTALSGVAGAALGLALPPYLAVLAVLLLSDRLRRKLRLFVSRHFRRPVYDYRHVWMDATRRTVSLVDANQLSTAVCRMVSGYLAANWAASRMKPSRRCAAILGLAPSEQKNRLSSYS